jgi:hypothetical protein
MDVVFAEDGLRNGQDIEACQNVEEVGDRASGLRITFKVGNLSGVPFRSGPHPAHSERTQLKTEICCCTSRLYTDVLRYEMDMGVCSTNTASVRLLINTARTPFGFL